MEVRSQPDGMKRKKKPPASDTSIHRTRQSKTQHGRPAGMMKTDRITSRSVHSSDWRKKGVSHSRSHSHGSSYIPIDNNPKSSEFDSANRIYMTGSSKINKLPFSPQINNAHTHAQLTFPDPQSEMNASKMSANLRQIPQLSGQVLNDSQAIIRNQYQQLINKYNQGNQNIHPSTLITDGPHTHQYSDQPPTHPFSKPSNTSTEAENPLVTPFQHHCLRSLASMIVCPYTVLPITIGLFHQSKHMGENLYLHILGDEITQMVSMRSLRTSHKPQTIPNRLCVILLPLLLIGIIGFILGLSLGTALGSAVTATALVSYIVVACFYACRRDVKNSQFVATISRYIRGCSLLLDILFCRPPKIATAAAPGVKLLPISVNIDSCNSGLDAVACMTEKIWQFAERKYSKTAVRLQWASGDELVTPDQNRKRHDAKTGKDEDVESRSMQSSTSTDIEQRDGDSNGSESVEELLESSVTLHTKTSHLGSQAEPLLNSKYRDTSRAHICDFRKGCASHTSIQWKRRLRQALIDIFRVLTIIDERMRDRQTRILLCITIGVSSKSGMEYFKLANFVRLVDRLLMKTQSCRSSGQISTMRNPQSSTTAKVEATSRDDNCAVSWTPNAIVIINSSVLSGASDTSTINAQSCRTQSPASLKRLQSSIQSKTWSAIHDACHLPVYLENLPFRAYNKQSPHHSSRGLTCYSPRMIDIEQQIPNSMWTQMLLGLNELGDLNVDRLRHLVTTCNFMARMGKLNDIQLGSSNAHRSSLGNFKWTTLHPQSLMVLTTWLCLLQHWPFHATWLATFIEQNLSQSSGIISDVVFRRSGSTKSQYRNRLDRDHVNADRLSTNSLRSTCNDPITMDTTLGQLHHRVLQRLSKAVEMARQKALSTSASFLQQPPGLDMNYYQSNNLWNSLDICNLAARDQNPKRLTRYLRVRNSRSTENENSTTMEHSAGLRPFEPGRITVGQLMGVMQLTPLINPQIVHWINGVLSAKSKEQHITNGKSDSVNIERSHLRTRSEDVSKPLSTTLFRQMPTINANLPGSCPVKLRHGLPTLPLRHMSVNDVCVLLRDIQDLSINQDRRNNQVHSNGGGDGGYVGSETSNSPINDLNPPAPTADKQERARIMCLYEDSIKRLNLTGNVLSICDLRELRKEFNMSFGDWQLFSSLIGYLRLIDSRSNDTERNVQYLSRRIRSQTLPNSGIPGQEKKSIFGTVSDTSLPLTIKSAPLDNKMHERRVNESIKRTNLAAKSLITLTNIQHPYGAVQHEQFGIPVLCPQHLSTLDKQNIENQNQSRAVYCSKHLPGAQYQIPNIPRDQMRRGPSHDPYIVQTPLVQQSNDPGIRYFEYDPMYNLAKGLPVLPQYNSDYLKTSTAIYPIQPSIYGIPTPIANRVTSTKSHQMGEHKGSSTSQSRATSKQLGQGNNAKDSESTSLAGEMAEEVADLTPIHVRSLIDPYTPRGEFESSDQPTDHSCDCQYWYPMERPLATTASIVKSDSNLECSMPIDREDSLSDSLSTTHSQVDDEEVDASSPVSSAESSTTSSTEQLHKIGV